MSNRKRIIEDYNNETNENKKNIDSVFDGFLNTPNDNPKVWSKVDDLIKVLVDMEYKHILNGEIPEFNNLIGDLEFYITEKNDVRIKFISWMINHYYNKQANDKYNSDIENENYEDAAILRDIFKVTEMPQNRG